MKKQTLLLHLTFIMLSFPSLFAKGIDIEAGMLNWWRCLLGSLFAFTILLFIKKASIPKVSIKWMALTGTIMGLHWWMFFSSIQHSTIGIGLISLFTYPIITVLLEPLFFKTKASFKQVIGGAGIVAGVFFLIPEFSLANDTTLGVFMGVLSALFISVRNILTKKHLGAIPAFTTMAYHVSFAFLVLTIPVLFTLSAFVVPSHSQFGLIFILGTIFTLGSHGLMVYSLKHFSAAKVGILGGLQVVYGTLLAYLIFTEIPSPNFYIGVIIILGVAIFEMASKKE